LEIEDTSLYFGPVEALVSGVLLAEAEACVFFL
jgi:hypothetical protein